MYEERIERTLDISAESAVNVAECPNIDPSANATNTGDMDDDFQSLP